MKQKIVQIAKSRFSNSLPLALFAGPCVIENERDTIDAASRLIETASMFGMELVFKASYDKANRSSIKSYRGPGIKAGLKILSRIKEKLGVLVLTDVHSAQEAREAAKVADILQVPAFLSRQTDIIVACAKTGKAVNVKKGQFLAPEDAINIVEKIENSGSSKIFLTERGASFGYHNLIVDMRSIEIMKRASYPVIFDATHSVQLPGGMGKTSGGQKEFVGPLARAAAALGIAGIFVEVHKNPAKALSDGPNSLSFSELEVLVEQVKSVDECVKNSGK